MSPKIVQAEVIQVLDAGHGIAQHKIGERLHRFLRANQHQGLTQVGHLVDRTVIGRICQFENAKSQGRVGVNQAGQLVHINLINGLTSHTQ